MDGILLMSVDPSPRNPEFASTELIPWIRDNHVEGQPVLVGAVPRDCCGVSRQAFLVSAIKGFLLSVRATGRRYPRVEPLGQREVE